MRCTDTEQQAANQANTFESSRRPNNPLIKNCRFHIGSIANHQPNSMFYQSRYDVIPTISAERGGREAGGILQIAAHALRIIVPRVTDGDGHGHFRSSDEDAVAVNFGFGIDELVIIRGDLKPLQSASVLGG